MKKVISFVLVLALVLGSFSMAFAAPATTGLTDIEGDANEVAIKVVNDLGIVTGYGDGSFQPAKAVTRAEFAAMITRALDIPESALAGYTSTTFKDTTGYGWAVPYLAFCNDKGIMLGDGAGNAMPGKTINVNEAMTMILRAMGLTNNSALLVGSWPSNYVTIAKSLGLYDDVAATNLVDRASAAQIIYNSLTEAGFVVNADGDTTAALPLIANLASYDITGVVDYDPDSLIPLAEYIGAYATVYYNSDDEIIAIDPISTFLSGEFDATAQELTVDDVVYKVAPTAVTTYQAIDNGAATVTTAALADGDVTLAVDVAGKTIKEVYSTVAWTVNADAQADEDVQDEIADDQELLGEAFELNKDNEIDEASFQLLGAASLDKIAEDDVVYVYTNGTYNTIIKIEVGTETVTGKVTKVFYDTDDATTYYAIGGKNYAATNGVVLDAGDEGTATLDYAGDIYAWEEDSSLAGNYAVLVATDSATSFGNTTYQVKLFTKDGAEITPDVYKDTTAAALGITPNSLVDFALNKDGKVNEITTTAITITNAAVEDDGSIIGTTKVASNVVVFIKDGSDYSIGKVSDLADKVTISAVVDDDEIVAILVDDAYTGSTDSTYGIITAYGATGLDADGDKITLADIILENVVKEDVQADVALTESTTGTALYEITIDEDGVITAATTGGIATETPATVSAISGNTITLAGGNSYRLADDVIVYIYDEDDGWTVGKIASVKKLTVVLCETDDDTAGYEYVIAY